GVDVGGTFTDLIYYDEATQEIHVAKAPTTPTAPEEGILDAVGIGVSTDQLGHAQLFLHGTTVGLNALLERRGAVVGLLATRGFRDVLEIRRGDRGDMYDLFWKPPPPLVPRRLRLPITERLYSDGTVHTAIELDDVRSALTLFRAEGVTAIAIAFLHAYANGEHELAAAAALREAGFDGEISLSHQISGEYREYERTTTTVIDAFVRGRMARYLDRLSGGLDDRGFDGSMLVTRSGGGSMTFAEAADRPFESIASGPVAGAQGAAELAARLGHPLVITADVGGTSFDTCLIQDGRLPLLYHGEVVGLPVQTSWVDVRSIGAGGGSIAYVDRGGLLRVGPRSAGAIPGPACYGRGGTEPTVTDAAVQLGMMGAGRLAGDLSLDRAAAAAALETVGAELGFDADEVAQGVLQIAAANMAGAIREITVEQGIDPRGAALMPFGGAGPLFLSHLIAELELSTAVIPMYAGNFSAWGLLGADLTQTAARTRVTPLTADGIAAANGVLSELFAQALERAARSATGDSRLEARLDMRYVGQEHTITVLLDGGNGQIEISPQELRLKFEDEYEQTFALRMDEAVEIVSLRAGVVTPLPRRGEATAATDDSAERHLGTVTAYSFHAGERVEFALLRREALGAGSTFEGPAILLEATATSYIDRDLRGEVDDTGCVEVSRQEA
ncbi:MAG TPA: hydantoinase/oxoprolinase family protein, partial [Solirubrobacteraceae bacterium]